MTEVEVAYTTVWDIAAQALDDPGFWIMSLVGLVVSVFVVRACFRRRLG